MASEPVVNFAATQEVSMSGGFERLSHVLPEESSVDAGGQLTIGGIPVVELARRYGTPLHVIGEAGLRRPMRRYVSGLTARWPNSEVLFASKSLPILAMYAVAASEGMSIDVAGLGELVMAIEAGGARGAHLPARQREDHRRDHPRDRVRRGNDHRRRPRRPGPDRRGAAGGTP